MSVAGSSLTQRIARMRGQLPAEEPGARGIEHWARNPQCQRLAALTLMGISPETAVRSIYQEPLHEGQSPFALALGTAFERLLFEHNATRLVDLYQRAGRLPPPIHVVNLDVLVPMTSASALARRRAYTRLYIQRKLNKDPRAPHLIIHGRLQVTVNGVPHDIEPDLLIAGETETSYRPGEIKSFPDRDGKTDPADLRSALRQAAVAVHGLWQLLLHLGVAKPQQLVPAEADLILKVPGSGQATLRPMTIQQECVSIGVVLERASYEFCAIEQKLLALGPQTTLDQAMVLDQIPAHFQPTCKEFCPIASHCKREAIATASSMILGQQACATFSPVGTLTRALACFLDLC